MSKVKNDHGKMTVPKGDGEVSIQRPNGIFRRYIKWNDRWRHVYVVSTHWQETIIGEPVKMVEFKLTKNSKTTHSAERGHFYKHKPSKKKEAL